MRFVISLMSWVLMACLTLSPSLAMAEDLLSAPTQEDAEKDTEPTPIEELKSGDTSDQIPGTEALYDKGVTITALQIVGNKLVPADKVLETMNTRPGSIYSKRRLQNDLKKIYDLGWFTDHIRAVPVANRDGVEVRIEVEENPTVNAIQFANNTVIKSEELAPLFAAQIGMPQNVNEINKGIQAVEQLYKDKGAVLAKVDNINEDPPGTITLSLNEGKIHAVRFTGNNKTKNYVIRRAMALKEGDVYNEKLVSEDLKRIFSTQAFSDVRRAVKVSADKPDEYDLFIEVDEKKTASISLGGGIDTGTGVFGQLGFSDPNLFGKGQNFSSVFSVGSGIIGPNLATLRRRVLQFNTNWFTPAIGESLTSLGVSAYARELGSFNVPLSIERRLGTMVTVGHPLERIKNASASLGVGFENIHLREGVDQTRLNQFNISPAERREQLQSGTYMYFDPAIAFDTRDNRFNPTRGHLYTFNNRFALGIQNDSFATASANLRRYVRMTDNVTLALNLQGASRYAGTMPGFNQFRLGGPFTIRGFQEGGVGIGSGFAMGTVELRSKLPFLKAFGDKASFLYDMLQVVAFSDAGLLFDEADTNSKFGRPGYAWTAGAGIRANIPGVGPLRIDFAHSLLGNKGRNTQSINFAVGQKF